MRQTVLRQIARPDEHYQLHIDVPAEFGAQVEVIVLRIEDELPSAANTTVLQAKGGFVNQVLANSAEDVWNDACAAARDQIEQYVKQRSRACV